MPRKIKRSGKEEEEEIRKIRRERNMLKGNVSISFENWYYNY